MELKIRNIGRVEKADILIQGITVVAGANGTGKSTVSKSLYSILEISDNSLAKAQVERTRSLRSSIVEWRRRNIPVSKIPIQQFIKKIEEIGLETDGRQETFAYEITGFLKGSVPEKFWDDQRMKKEIQQLYITYNEIAGTGWEYYLEYVSQLVLNDVFQEQINCLNNDGDGSIYYKDGDTSTKIGILKHRIQEMKIDFGPGVGQPVYITTPDLMDSVGTYGKLYSAERGGTISYANAQLSRLLMEKKDSRYLVAEEYNRIEEQKEQLQGVLQEVLEGEIYLENDRIAYHDRWCDSSIELSNISSGMKIFLILQSLVTNGIFLERTCLIIDEPETNLHPDWQLKLAHLLVLLNKKLGILIYLNSHSPYFVRAIEFYSNQHQILGECNFYIMKKNNATGMYQSECVTEHLGIIYDEMAEPFNKIM